MKIRITKITDERYWYAKKVGEVFEVDNYEWSDEWYAVKKQKGHGCSLYCILKQDCEEVTMEQPKKTMNLKEAYFAMLDGKQVVFRDDDSGTRFYYSDKNGRFEGVKYGNTWKAVFELLASPQFELYEPPAPHKYSVGQFVYIANDIGKIKGLAGHTNNKPTYNLQISSSGVVYGITEDKIGGLA